jgi:hypothetical protein
MDRVDGEIFIESIKTIATADDVAQAGKIAGARPLADGTDKRTMKRYRLGREFDTAERAQTIVLTQRIVERTVALGETADRAPIPSDDPVEKAHRAFMWNETGDRVAADDHRHVTMAAA